MGILDDVRYAIRSLARRPAFTLFASLTVALGIGATTAIFSTLEGVILRPLPYEGAERVVGIWRKIGNSGSFMTPTADQLEEWRDQTDLLESAQPLGIRSMVLTGGAQPRLLSAVLVEPGFLDFIGRSPIIGRGFAPEELRGDGQKVILLSHAFWTTDLGGDQDVLGRTLTLDGEPWTVVGVMPPNTPVPSFGATTHQLWRPLTETIRSDGAQVVGRLREGVELTALQTRLEELEARATAASGGERVFGGAAVSIVDMTSRGFRETLIMLMGAVALLMLIACVNVSNLLLNRATARRRETAIRGAMGASRGRLTRQLLVESVLLALLGAVGGVLFALGARLGISRLRPAALAALDLASLNVRVLAFAVALALTTGLLFGLLPALQLGRQDDHVVLRSGARTDGGGIVGRRLRWILVTAEVALSFTLLLASVAVIQSVSSLQRADVGFEVEGLAALTLELPTWRYETEAERNRVLDEVTDRIAALPGVTQVTEASSLPPRSGVTFGKVETDTTPPGEDTEVFFGPAIRDGYFETLGQPILAGRGFTSAEIADGAPVAVLGESTARRLFGEEDAVGRTFRIGEDEWTTVVGVVGDVAMTGLNSSVVESLQLYTPLGEQTGSYRRTVIVRTAADADPAALLPVLRDRVAEVTDVGLVENVNTAEGLMLETLARERFSTTLMTVFAGLALALAAIGLFGVVSQVVGQRVPEIGIRMALGARAWAIRGMVVRQGALATAAGVVLGLGLTAITFRLLESQLVGLEQRDPSSYVLAAVILITTALGACYVPARRASRIDPVRSIRSE